MYKIQLGLIKTLAHPNNLGNSNWVIGGGGRNCQKSDYLCFSIPILPWHDPALGYCFSYPQFSISVLVVGTNPPHPFCVFVAFSLNFLTLRCIFMLNCICLFLILGHLIILPWNISKSYLYSTKLWLSIINLLEHFTWPGQFFLTITVQFSCS